MAERLVRNCDNIHKKYRKVNLVNPYLFAKPFESRWRTSNTSTGSSTSTQVKLPLVSSGGIYNFIVDWGDGSSNVITAWNQPQATHTYSVAGDYTIKISGTCIGWQFANSGDRLKILSVSTWGNLKFGTVSGNFWGCANLNLSGVTDILNLSGTTLLFQTFQGCTSLTTIGRLNEWDVSNIVQTRLMFQGCSSFNQNIGNWDVGKVTNFQGMFQNATSFNNGGSSTIGNWNVSNAGVFGNTSSSEGMFQGATSFNQNLSAWNVSKATSFHYMFQGASSFNNGLASGVSGTMPWTINTTAGVAMSFMFNGANAFNQDISSWNTSRVTTMVSMFQATNSFNNGLAIGVAGNMLWNFGNVNNMTDAFNSAVAFNQNLGTANMANVTSFSRTFSGAIRYNNGGSTDINSWTIRTAGAVTMSQMFSTATVFNQPIGNWNTSQVTDMSSMFRRTGGGTNLFNQNIGAWNVGNVVDFSTMFYGNAGNVSFNNGGSSDINNWVLKSTGTINMNGMFINSPFNQPIGNWNVGNVTNMGSMFSANSVFNQNISTWNVANVLDMSSMFNNAQAFNQPIGVWNVGSVTNMSLMFNVAAAFNQNIGSWNISNVTNFTSFMAGKTAANFSTANLDAIYNSTTGWASRPVKPSISISFGTAKYTAAGTPGRAILTGSPNLWTISDGGI